jgi:hypothetical protein
MNRWSQRNAAPFVARRIDVRHEFVLVVAV